MESHSPRKLIRYEGEHAFQKDLIQWIYSDDGAGDGRLTDEGLAAIPEIFALTQAGSFGARNRSVSALVKIVGPGVAFIGGSRKDLERATEGAMNEFCAAVGVPFYEQSIRGRNYFEELIDRHASNNLIGLAAYRFRLQHDRFPETADELVPEFLEEIPVDVVTGQPLHYRLQAGQPLIYSVGQDRDDDEGAGAFGSDGERLYAHEHFEQNVTQPADGDWILWPSE